MSDLNELATGLKTVFQKNDKSQTQKLSRAKLETLMKSLDPSFTPEELDALFENLGNAPDGQVNYQEFIDYVCFSTEERPVSRGGTSTRPPSEKDAFPPAPTEGSVGTMKLGLLTPIEKDALPPAPTEGIVGTMKPGLLAVGGNLEMQLQDAERKRDMAPIEKDAFPPAPTQGIVGTMKPGLLAPIEKDAFPPAPTEGFIATMELDEPGAEPGPIEKDAFPAAPTEGFVRTMKPGLPGDIVDEAGAELDESWAEFAEAIEAWAGEIFAIIAEAAPVTDEQARLEEEEEEEEEEEKAGKEAEEKARLEAEEKALKKAEETARKEAEEKARLEAEEKARKEAEEKARLEAAEKARKDVEEKARLEAEEQARKEAEEKAGKEAEEKARLEAEEKARNEAEEKARLEAEEKTRKEAEEKGRLEAEEKALQEVEEKARLEAEEQARKEAEVKAGKEAEENARLEAEEKTRNEAEEKARLEAEEKARKEAEEKARLDAEENAIKEAEEKVRLEAEEKAREEAEEKARKEAKRRKEVHDGCIFFTITLEKDKTQEKYGFGHIDGKADFRKRCALAEKSAPEHFIIKNAEIGGLLEKWNEEYPDANVIPTDRVVAVNGADTIAGMKKELQQPSVDLRIARYPMTFEVDFEKEKGRKLGVRFEKSPNPSLQELVVTSLTVDGLVSEHNDQKLSAGEWHSVIVPGMRIIAVNDVKGDTAAMTNEMAKASSVRICFRRMDILQIARGKLVAKVRQILTKGFKLPNGLSSS